MKGEQRVTRIVTFEAMAVDSASPFNLDSHGRLKTDISRYASAVSDADSNCVCVVSFTTFVCESANIRYYCPPCVTVQVIEGVRNCDENRIYCSGFNKSFIDSPSQ